MIIFKPMCTVKTFVGIMSLLLCSLNLFASVRENVLETLPPLNMAQINKAKRDGAGFSPDNRILLHGKSKSKKFTVPDGVIEIADMAFVYSSHISHVVIPDSVSKIGNRAFFNGVNKLEITPGNKSFMLDKQGALIDLKKKRLIFVPPDLKAVYVVPEEVREIAPFIFTFNNLKGIVINKNIRDLSSRNLVRVPNVKISKENPKFKIDPQGAVIDIENKKLIIMPDQKKDNMILPIKEYVTPADIKSIGNYAFSENRSVRRVKLTDNIIEIGEGAFDNSMLRYIELSRNLKILRRNALRTQSCTCCGLNSLKLPGRIEIIEESALSGINKVILEADNDFFEMDSNGVLIDRKHKKILYMTQNIYGDYQVPEGIVRIGAFSGRHLQVRSIVFPKSLKEIGEGAFFFCPNLQTVSIPGTVKKIEKSAFNFCGRLLTVKLSEGLKEIGPTAFSGCRFLKSISIPDSVVSVGDRAFEFCVSLETIRVPKHFSDSDVRKWGIPAKCKILRTRSIADPYVKQPVQKQNSTKAKLKRLPSEKALLDGNLPFGENFTYILGERDDKELGCSIPFSIAGFNAVKVPRKRSGEYEMCFKKGPYHACIHVYDANNRTFVNEITRHYQQDVRKLKMLLSLGADGAGISKTTYPVSSKYIRNGTYSYYSHYSDITDKSGRRNISHALVVLFSKRSKMIKLTVFGVAEKKEAFQQFAYLAKVLERKVLALDAPANNIPVRSRAMINRNNRASW